MTISTSKVVLQAVAMPLVGPYSNNFRCTVKAMENNAKVAYIGNAAVTTDNGFPIEPGETIMLHNMKYNDLYCVGKAGDELRIIMWSN